MTAYVEPRLVPLRIREGWFVSHNQLREVDPEHLPVGDLLWRRLMQDLMQLKLVSETMLVDVGWYPDGDPAGEYGVTVIVDGDWHRPIARFATRNLKELVAKLEDMMWHPPVVPSDRLIERLGGEASDRRCSAAEELARRGEVSAIDAVSAALQAETIPAARDRLSAARDTLLAERARRA